MSSRLGGLVPPQLRGLLADTATRNSLLLMGSAVGSGLLNFVFWTLVARRNGPVVVGAASAELSTVTFLAGMGSLNMINVFARFLPEAGDRSRRLITIGYAAALLTGLVIVLIFLATPWAHGLVVGGRAGRVGFVVLVVAASVFLIQDGGLIGLGRSRLVPVENITVAAARLVAFGIVALTASRAVGIVTAWAIPTVLAVVVVNTFMIGRWAPAEAHRISTLPSRRELGGFIAVESVTTAISSSLTSFLPAIVSEVMGKDAAGFFYVPWLIANVGNLLLLAVLISMVRESVARPAEAAAILRRSLIFAAAIVGAATVGCTVLGRPVLHILGPAFVHGSGSLLIWIGLSFPATAVALIYWSVCLIGRKPWPVFGMNLATTVLTISGVALLGHGDVDRVGWLYCGVQYVVAIAVARPGLRALRHLVNRSDDS
jgi:O-antigen/teichoic acid export membrane protein